MIKNIVFDIGNVLVDFRYQAYMSELGFSNEVAKIFTDRIILNNLWSQLDLGVRDEKDIFNEMKMQVRGYEKEFDLFINNLLKIVDNFDYSRQWILSLKSKGYKVYLLSNYPKSLFELHSEKVFNFADTVDGKVVSAFVKMIKPNQDIYEYLLNKYKLDPSECLFFDDRQENIDAALVAGLNAHLFTGYEDAVKIIDSY